VFLSNALIGLREGLEAGMVVIVLIAFLSGRDRRHEIRFIWIGVAVALVASAAAGALLAITASSLTPRGEELFQAGASALAVLLVTGMIFWMRHSVREERRQLEGQISKAIVIGPIAIFAVALIAVLREGLEAAVFVLVLADGTSVAASVGGLLVGIVASVALTSLMYVGLIRVNMARFLTMTGLVLIVVAAGILAHGLTGLQEAGVLPGADTFAFDATAVLSTESWMGHFVSGLFGVSAKPTVLALVTWAGYLVVVLTLFLIALRAPDARRKAVAEHAATADEVDLPVGKG
jgi:high-affinity iron transporter